MSESLQRENFNEQKSQSKNMSEINEDLPVPSITCSQRCKNWTRVASFIDKVEHFQNKQDKYYSRPKNQPFLRTKWPFCAYRHIHISSVGTSK